MIGSRSQITTRSAASEICFGANDSQNCRPSLYTWKLMRVYEDGTGGCLVNIFPDYDDITVVEFFV